MPNAPTQHQQLGNSPETPSMPPHTVLYQASPEEWWIGNQRVDGAGLPALPCSIEDSPVTSTSIRSAQQGGPLLWAKKRQLCMILRSWLRRRETHG